MKKTLDQVAIETLGAQQLELMKAQVTISQMHEDLIEKEKELEKLRPPEPERGSTEEPE